MQVFAILSFAFWIILLWFLPQVLQFIKLYKFANTLTGPTISELLEITRTREVLNWLKVLRKRYGSTFRIWFGKDLIVFFTDPEDVRQILTSNALLYKSSSYKQTEAWLGKGLLTSGGAEWHRRRKLLTPAFHFRILSEFKEPMEENCEILIDALRAHVNGEAFDVYPYLTLFALDAICETAMGIKKNAQTNRTSEYVQAVQDICSILHKQSFSFWQRFPIIFRFSEAAKARDAAIKVLHDETNRVIKLRRKQLQDANIATMADVDKTHDSSEHRRRFAFLDMLLITQMEGGGLTDREIREEVDTFMFEGHDTTSSAIAFTLYLLSQHADVQQKAYDEAVDLQGNEKESMRYLEAVIKESLRLYPSVPFYSRSVNEDLQVGNLNIPKGANISTLAYMIHRNEAYYPEPEKFNPERFLVSSSEMHPFAFVAFSAGPRNCIGQKFAMLELKITLSNILRNFELLPAENFKPHPKADLVMKSSNGVQLCLRERK